MFIAGVRERESPIRVPQKQLAFDPHAQRKSKVNCNAHRRARSRRHKYDGPDQFDYQERPRIREKWRGDKDTLYGSARYTGIVPFAECGAPEAGARWPSEASWMLAHEASTRAEIN